MAAISPIPKLQFFDANGAPLSGGKLYTYEAGTTTPLATYTDYGAGTPNANPVILDSRGEASVWLGSLAYKMALKTSADATVWTVDNMNHGDTATLAALAASGGSALVGYINGGTGAVATTVQTKLRESVSVKDFGAVGDGTTDDTAAIQAAITYCANNDYTLLIPDGIFGFTNVTVPAGAPLRLLGFSKENSVLKKLNPSVSATAAIICTGEFSAKNLCFNQSWLTAIGAPSGTYDDSVSATTWGGNWMVDVTLPAPVVNATSGIYNVSITDCLFIGTARGIIVVNANHLEFSRNTGQNTDSYCQTICAASYCLSVSMNDNYLSTAMWSVAPNGNGGSGVFNFNCSNLEICNNTFVGHQLVGRGSVGTFTASISGTTLTVTALAANVAIYPGMSFSGTNVLADQTIVEQLTGTTGSTGTYTLAFDNSVVGSGTCTLYLTRLVCDANIIDTPIADTAFYGWKAATVNNNVVRMSGDMGIALDGCQYVTCNNNVINGVMVGGIHIGSAYGVTCVGNVVKDVAQATNGAYSYLVAYARYASNSPSLCAISIDYAGGNSVSKGFTVTGNTVYWENYPPVSDALGPVAAVTGGIRVQDTTNPASIMTGSVTGNYVVPAYATVPAAYVYVPDHYFYLAAAGAITGTPIGGDLYTDGGSNSFILLDPIGNGALCYIKKLVGTVPSNTTFTGTLNAATIISANLPQLTFLGLTGAANMDWTTTYANQNKGV